MKPGRASKTAELVCMARAVAHGSTPVVRFQDPTALALLPEPARARVQRYHADPKPKGVRARFDRGYLLSQSQLMVARTIEIDDAIRGVYPAPALRGGADAVSPQVVILGAGLDGRAWRMPELRDAIVFEVDHPDSQREKRARTATLTQTARELRFVAVDFTHGALDQALAAAGHEQGVPTTWVWEGVVMYLTPDDVRASLAVIAHRSAAGSRLIIAYHAPAPVLVLVGPMVRLLGEPLRSTFTAEQMRALLAEYGFRVTRDKNAPEIAAELSADLAHAVRMLTHMRIVTADR